MIGKACFLPFSFWASVSVSEHLPFHGYFSPVVDSWQFSSMMQILLALSWPSNEPAVTVPSILSAQDRRVPSAAWLVAEKTCFCFHKLEKTRALCLVWQLQDHKTFLPHSAPQHVSHRVLKATKSLLPMNGLENFRKRSCTCFECVCVKRSFTRRKGNWLSNVQALQQCPRGVSVSSYLLGLSLGVIFEWHVKYRTQVLCCRK